MTADDIKAGTEIFLPALRGRGGHGAYITVHRVNKATISGYEKKGSYSPSTWWKIHKSTTMAIVTYDGSRVEGEITINGLMRLHWIN